MPGLPPPSIHLDETTQPVNDSRKRRSSLSPGQHGFPPSGGVKTLIGCRAVNWLPEMGRPSPPLVAQTPTHTIPYPDSREVMRKRSSQSSASTAQCRNPLGLLKWLNKRNLAPLPPPLRLARAELGARCRAGRHWPVTVAMVAKSGVRGLGCDREGSEMAARNHPAF